MMPQLFLSDEAIQFIKNGKPIIDSGFLAKNPPFPEPGTWVQLADGRGQAAGCGFVDKKRESFVRVVGGSEGMLSKPKASYFKNKLLTAHKKRSLQFAGQPTDVYRLLNGEGDGIPGLILDRYGDYGVAWATTPGLKTISPIIYEAAYEIFNLKGIYEKGLPSKGVAPGQEVEERPVIGQAAPPEIYVNENNMRLKALLSCGPKTGVYHDQRENRKILTPLFKNSSLLNTFSYTGAFSVYAALSGARETVSVDISKRALSWSKENFLLNGIDLAAHRHVKADVFDYLKLAQKKGFKFDGVILDPITFSTSRKGVFRAKKDWPRLISESIKVLNRGGWLALSCNTKTLSDREIRRFLNQGARAMGRQVKTKAKTGLPDDFPIHPQLPEMDYLKFYLVRIP